MDENSTSTQTEDSFHSATVIQGPPVEESMIEDDVPTEMEMEAEKREIVQPTYASKSKPAVPAEERNNPTKEPLAPRNPTRDTRPAATFKADALRSLNEKNRHNSILGKDAATRSYPKHVTTSSSSQSSALNASPPRPKRVFSTFTPLPCDARRVGAAEHYFVLDQVRGALGLRRKNKPKQKGPERGEEELEEVELSDDGRNYDCIGDWECEDGWGVVGKRGFGVGNEGP